MESKGAKGLAHEIVKDILKVREGLGRLPSGPHYFKNGRFSEEQVLAVFKSWVTARRCAGEELVKEPPEEPREPRILIFDIETAPIVAHVWSIWEQNVGLNQIVSDWHVLAWAAKWANDPPSKIIYRDQRRIKPIEHDKRIMEDLWNLLDEADVVVTQNGKQFDAKKVNARFILNGMKPPSPYKHIDTKILAKRHFAFTSNKLEYLSDKLCVKYKKLKHGEFAGFALWKECLLGNPKAWREMEKYNKHDVLATEELWQKLSPWGTGINGNVFRGEAKFKCQELACGSDKLQWRGPYPTTTGLFKRFQCQDCGTWGNTRGKEHNQMTKRKRESLKGPR